jgi:hypothetical protein
MREHRKDEIISMALCPQSVIGVVGGRSANNAAANTPTQAEDAVKGGFRRACRVA